MSKGKKNRKHQFDYRFISWMVCTKCGLATLNNAITRKEMGKACPGAEHEDQQQ